MALQMPQAPGKADSFYLKIQTVARRNLNCDYAAVFARFEQPRQVANEKEECLVRRLKQK